MEDEFHPFYEPIGRLIVAQSMMHNAMMDMLETVLVAKATNGMPPGPAREQAWSDATKRARRKTVQMDAEKLAKAIRCFLDGAGLEQHRLDLGSRALDTFDKAQQLRNELAHGELWHNPFFGTDVPRLNRLPEFSVRFRARRDKGVPTWSPQTPEAIAEIAERVNEARKDVEAVFHDWDFPRRKVEGY